MKTTIDSQIFKPPEQRTSMADCLRLITIGTLSWHAGLEYLLLALRILLDRGISANLVIVGQGPDLQRLHYTIFDLELQSKVYVTASLTPDQRLDQLQQAHIFVLTNVDDTSNCAFEAMSCELPIVFTDCGSLREVVGNSVGGILVPMRDPEVTADAIEQLAHDAELCLRMGRAGRERILREFMLAR